MSRPLSASIRSALAASESSMVLPLLITIDHADLTTPIRLCNNNVDLVYGGETYYARAFRFDGHDEGSDGITSARLVLDAVDQVLIETMLDLAEAPTITVDARFWDDPATGTVFEAVASWEYVLQSITADVAIISAELAYEDWLDNEAGPLEFTPTNSPGLF